MKTYSTTAQVLNQAIQQFASQADWNLSEPGTSVIQDITYTVLPYDGADPVTISYIPGGTAGHEVVTVSDSAISVKIQDGVTTATQLLAALNGSASAMTLVYAVISGTAGHAQAVLTAPVIAVGDIVLRIMEADKEINMRLAGMGIVPVFSVNPPPLQDMSMIYARYACLRDLYTGANPQANSESAKAYLDRFNSKWDDIKAGWQVFVDTYGAAISSSKYTPQTVDYPAPENPIRDNYPNAPQGPYPDLPGILGD